MDYGFFFDLASGFFYNFLIIIGIIVGCIISANNKNGLPAFWIFFDIQLFSVIGIFIQINRGDAYSTLYFDIVLFILLSIVGVCLISTVRKKAAEREANREPQEEKTTVVEEKPQYAFVCKSCNNTFSGWYKECPRCHSIDTMERRENKVAVAISASSSVPPQQEIIEEEIPATIEPIISSSASEQMVFCRKCGAKIPTDSAFCPKCGEKVINI